jgi:hypothetical protein
MRQNISTSIRFNFESGSTDAAQRTQEIKARFNSNCQRDNDLTNNQVKRDLRKEAMSNHAKSMPGSMFRRDRTCLSRKSKIIHPSVTSVRWLSPKTTLSGAFLVVRSVFCGANWYIDRFLQPNFTGFLRVVNISDPAAIAFIAGQSASPSFLPPGSIES